MDARRLAFETLLEVEGSRAFADAVLGRALARCSLDRPDRKLATLLVYGTLARRLTLDHTLSVYVDRALARLDLRVLVLLRLGLFQIAFLDRVPAYAAVDTAVALARRLLPAAAGLVNAVLRRAARQGLVPPAADTAIERLSIVHSHPTWLVERWLDELGAEQAEALLAADNQPMPTVVRALGPRQEVLGLLARRGVEARPARYAPEGIVISNASGFEGLAVPHGEASQLVVLFVGAEPGARVLDACAAPGGKAAYLAARVGPQGRVTAVDPSPSAEARIRRIAAAGAVPNVDVVMTRIEQLPVTAPFDAVLVDVPCSGLGTLREHPEIRWRRTPEDIDDLRRRQRAILAAAARHTGVGGTLVYATCTLIHAENDAVVDDFLSSDPAFTEDASAARHPALSELVGADGRLRTFPHRHDMAGFFAARLRRVAAASGPHDATPARS